MDPAAWYRLRRVGGQSVAIAGPTGQSLEWLRAAIS
jgi:hypothetical protein